MNGGSVKSEDGGGGSSSPGGSSPTGSTSGSRTGGESGGRNSDVGCPSCRQLLCSGSCLKQSSISPPTTPNPTNNSGSGISQQPPGGPTGLQLNYQRLASAGVPLGVYSGAGNNPNSANHPYSPDQVAYIAAAAAAAAAEHQALYAAAGGGLPDMKDGGMGQGGWGYPSLYHPYDPGFAAAAAAAAAYPFNGYAVDVNGSRRKNATRETTSTLKAWLAEHKKNPYPTKGEKIMLAIITKMTLTQVSTWFANARRRLKKENKMTWEPRNRPDDDDDVDISDSEPEQRKSNDDHDNERLSSGRVGNSHHVHGKSSPTGSSCSDVSKDESNCSPLHNSHSKSPLVLPVSNKAKPRIWSLADLAGNGNGNGGSGAGSGNTPHHESSHHHNHHNNHHHNNHNNHHRSSSSHLSTHHSSSLPGSAFSPLGRGGTGALHPHSEAIYRGLYPLPTAAHHHHHHHPAVYHPDNP